jgi:hypothetical protein
MFMEIPIEIDKNYGILLSGGLDSAVLLYLLISNNPKIKIQPFTIPKFDGAYLYADPLIDHFNNKFVLDIPKTKKVGSAKIYHSMQNRIAAKEIFENYQIDHLFIAINRVPEELKNLPGVPDRTQKSYNPKISFPFVDLTKDKILDIMFKFNQEDLMYLTHSCTEQQLGRCGICWQCQERAWAFRSIGQLDYGLK